jgi:hypothetical protein
MEFTNACKKKLWQSIPKTAPALFCWILTLSETFNLNMGF